MCPVVVAIDMPALGFDWIFRGAIVTYKYGKKMADGPGNS